MKEKHLIKSKTGATTGFRHELLLTTIEHVEGYRIKKVLGFVRGNTIRARNIGVDILAVLRNIAGGEILEYTKLMAESREQALDRMVEQAVQLGANAVIGTHLTTSMLMGGAAEILAYGTAVILEKLPPSSESSSVISSD